MWISKIELKNFKSYRLANFEFPEPKNGKNIVLIGGMNGYGKTTILEAIYLCLYGKDAMTHLARAGLKMDEKGYPTFLEHALNGEAKRDDDADMMSARMIIKRNKTSAFDIRRRWYFKSAKGTWHEEETVVTEIIKNLPGTPKIDGKNSFFLSELLDEQFVPAHIAPFFFFDGEEVKKLADQTRIEQVKQGLEGLLGVVLLRNLVERLRNFESNKRQTISSSDEENIDRLLELMTADEAKLKDLTASTQESRNRLSEIKAEHQSLIERIISAGGGGADIATVRDFVEEQQAHRNDLRLISKSLERILSDKLPFHLMPVELLDEFKAQLHREIEIENWQAECNALEPKRDSFKNAFLKIENPVIDPVLTDSQLEAVQARIEQAWASLFHPSPVADSGPIVHRFFHQGLREKALNFLSTLSVGQAEVQDLLSKQRQVNERIEELSKKISRVEGIDKDGTLTELKKNLATVEKERDELEATERNSDRILVGLEVGLSNTKARYQQEKKRLDDTSPTRQLIDKSERVRQAIDELIPSLFPLKVKRLATSMTRVYKQLAHKTQVSKIIISDDGSTQILSRNGQEITFDRSAGENQIFATALIAGLAEVSGVSAPLVVDTPLGRLDSKHRDNIFNFWTGTPNRQVILLSQDKEVDATTYKKIKDKVNCIYLLEHTDVGDGIGRTIAKPETYFGDTI